MLKRKVRKSCGKLPLSKYFQEFAEGDRVAIVREHSENPSFAKRIQGLCGVVTGTQGSAYIIKLKDGNAERKMIITPIHLKKLK